MSWGVANGVGMIQQRVRSPFMAKVKDNFVLTVKSLETDILERLERARGNWIFTKVATGSNPVSCLLEWT